ncbi:MAG: hypothetical protein AAGB26_08675 [Planctomycetota bacterium]
MQEAGLTDDGTQADEPHYSASTPEEVRSDLKHFIASVALVEFCLFGGDDTFCGFPIFLGEDYVVVTRLFQQCWENSFRAIRLEHVDDVFEIEKDGSLSANFVRRARHARGLADGPTLPFEEPTFSALLGMICNHFSVVVLNGETSIGKSFDFAGRVSSSDANSLRVRLFEEDGYWQNEDQVVPVSEIHGLFFDSEYERTLVAMSQLDDS